ncbi:hypothetical protein AB0M36_15920 [Actinoplanes sp. NPDC051346]|uniref:hypothetical protein n=1 Tax=Actinoplanes sp. NPDC051346 TaxID=3155048 RepID=UPI00344740E7
MTQQNERLPALGDDDGTPDKEGDFAGEHDTTAVEPAIVEGRDDGEQESPRGWSGMENDGPP